MNLMNADAGVEYIIKEIVTEDEESARKMLEFSPAVYVGMSTKDVYRILDNVKRYQNS